jgi:hypothetical protein
VRQYGRYFLGSRHGEEFAQGLMMLEKNWRGPLRTNLGVETTLKHFQALEKKARPPELLNWRFQQALYRAYFDEYTRRRLLWEIECERLALEFLAVAKQLGSTRAIISAEAVLENAVTNRREPELRARIFELAEALFQSIRMQLSVERYKAISVGRGANLDTIDMPLNNRLWLNRQFEELRKLEKEEDRLRGLDAILHWTDPGPGGFYDDLGDPSRRPDLVAGKEYAKDPAFYQSPLTGFGYSPNWRISWCRHAETLFDTPLKMRYSGLDKQATYKLRVVYAGDNFRARLRLTANESIEIHPYISKSQPVKPVQFDIPIEATRGGELNLNWTQEPGRGGSGRGCQVAEVWLLRK